jgi:hypothetical protein
MAGAYFSNRGLVIPTPCGTLWGVLFRTSRAEVDFRHYLPGVEITANEIASQNVALSCAPRRRGEDSGGPVSGHSRVNGETLHLCAPLRSGEGPGVRSGNATPDFRAASRWITNVRLCIRPSRQDLKHGPPARCCTHRSIINPPITTSLMKTTCGAKH